MGSYFPIICALLLHISLGWAVDNPSCAGSERCFETSKQGFHVALQSVSKDGIHVVASGPSTDPKNYLAIGFTKTGQMQSAAVFICLPENKVNQYVIGASHSPPVPKTFTTVSNPEVVTQGGQVKCSFTIPVLFSADPEKSFDLSKQQDSSFVLLATGSSDGTGNIGQHSSTGRIVEPIMWPQTQSHPQAQPQPPSKQPAQGPGPSPSTEAPKATSQPTPRDSAASSLIPTVASLVFISSVIFSTFFLS